MISLKSSWFPTTLVMALFLISGISSSVAEAPGTATATFLKLDPYAESAAQGSASLGNSGISSIYFNPAGLGFLELTETSVTQNDIFAGITYRNASLVHSTEQRNGGFGLSLTSMNFGEQDRTRIRNNDPLTDLGKFSANDLSLNASYGLRLRETLSVGAGLKYVESNIAGYQAGTMSGDLGLQYRTPEKSWRFGLAGRNLFGSLKFNKRSDPLPRVYELGGNYRVSLVPAEHEFDFGFGTGVSNDSDGYFFGGLVYELFNVGSFRFGYHGAKDAGDGITFGTGLHYAGVHVDYAYVPFGDLGRQQRFSFSYRFGGVKQSAPKAKTKEPVKEKTERPVPSSNDNRNIAGRLDRARRLYRDGSLEKSYDLLRKLHREVPDHVDVLLWLGILEHKMGDRPSAIKRMNRVLELDPDNEYAQTNLKKLQKS